MALYDINGNMISTGGNGGSHFLEVETLPDGLALPCPPNTFSDDENWKYSGNDGTLYEAIGGTRFLYTGRIFTGRVYIRYTTTSSSSVNPTAMHIVAEDFLENITNEGTKLESTISKRMMGGKYLYVSEDGEDTVFTSDPAVPEGYVATGFSQYDIPEGQYAVLSSLRSGTVSNTNHFVNNWFAVFTTDIFSEPTRMPKGSSLQMLDAINKEGFGKGTAENEYFQRYLREQIDKIMPMYYCLQTRGKSLYVGGDSLTQYSGGDGFGVNNGFITNYNKYFGFKTITSHGYAGSTWSGTSGGGGIKRITDLITAGVPYDVFIFAWGTNPDTDGVGTVDDEASETATTTCGAMKWCIEQLRATFPKSAIGIVIPPPKMSETDMDAQADIMIQLCEKLHVPYIDMRKYLSIVDMSSDLVHLGYGIEKYGSAEAKLILDICPYGEPLD